MAHASTHRKMNRTRFVPRAGLVAARGAPEAASLARAASARARCLISTAESTSEPGSVVAGAPNAGGAPGRSAEPADTGGVVVAGAAVVVAGDRVRSIGPL